MTDDKFTKAKRLMRPPTRPGLSGRMGVSASGRMGDAVIAVPLIRWGEKLGAPWTWLLCKTFAPVLSRSVREAAGDSFSKTPEPVCAIKGFGNVLRWWHAHGAAQNRRGTAFV